LNITFSFSENWNLWFLKIFSSVHRSTLFENFFCQLFFEFYDFFDFENTIFLQVEKPRALKILARETPRIRCLDSHENWSVSNHEKWKIAFCKNFWPRPSLDPPDQIFKIHFLQLLMITQINFLKLFENFFTTFWKFLATFLIQLSTPKFDHFLTPIFDHFWTPIFDDFLTPKSWQIFWKFFTFFLFFFIFF